MSILTERLSRRLPDVTDEALLAELAEGAEAFVRAYTNGAPWDAALIEAALRIAVMDCNRMGMEGETKHAEGGVTHEVQALPDDVRTLLNAHRVVRTCGT